MSAGPSAPDGPDAFVADDPLTRLVALRRTTERRLQAMQDAAPRARPAARRRLLLALQMRWKLDEQSVAPRLDDVAAGEPTLPNVERESLLLREGADLLETQALPAAAQRALLSTLTGLSALRAERLEAALAAAIQRGDIDTAALARDIDERLVRWRDEVLATGDIEDEEIDPVGTPPR